MNESSRKTVRGEVLKLIEQKEQLENEIKELQNILTKNNVGMDEPLVDNEGFPLASVDVYQVRHARQLIICKQNDYKAIMKQIEQGIAQYYDSPPMDTSDLLAAALEEMQANVNQVKHEEPVEHVQPFASVNIVHEGSPADAAGIKQGDTIVEFGSINSTNFRGIEDIGSVVRHSHGNAIIVKLKRGDRFLRVQLLPREWNGRGLLG